MKTKLKIALIMRGGQAWMGGFEYIKNLILALGSLSEKKRSTFEIHLITSEPLGDSIQQQLAPYISQVYTDELLQPGNFINRSRWFFERKLLKIPDQRLEALIRKHGFDFVYPHVTTKFSRYRSVAWIPDFQHKYLPHFFSEVELRSRDQRYASIAKRAEMVILSSKTAAEDFKNLFPEAASKAQVLSFKTSPSLTWYDSNPEHIQHLYNLPDRFFIVSNQFWQHKNHIIVFEALKLLKARGINPTVVCTGHIFDYRKHDYVNILLKAIHQFGLASQVRLLGLIPKLDQVQLVRRSLALIQPSLFEGWSTIVEDARSLGKTIILSDLPVHLEQDPPYSIFFDQTSAEQLAQRMEEIWTSRSPGPDFVTEQQAHEASSKAVMRYGSQFLEIAGGDS